jgi:hypothetical protein
VLSFLTTNFNLQVINAFVPFLLRDVINYYNEKAPETLRLSLDSAPDALVTTGVALIIACKCFYTVFRQMS